MAANGRGSPSQDGFVPGQVRSSHLGQSSQTLEHKVYATLAFKDSPSQPCLLFWQLALVKQEKHDLQLRLLQLEDKVQDADLLQQEVAFILVQPTSAADSCAVER